MKRKSVLSLSKYGIIAAVLYCIPLIFFIKSDKFSSTWLLYLGNALFLFYSFIFVAFFAEKNDSEISPLNAGMTVTITGIIFSCILSLVCVLLFAPGLFHIGTGNEVLEKTPAALPTNNSHGIWILIFANVIIGNITAGTVGSVLARSATQKRKV